MNAPTKIQIDSSLSALAKAHQELLAIFEVATPKRGQVESTVSDTTAAPKRSVRTTARKDG